MRRPEVTSATQVSIDVLKGNGERRRTVAIHRWYVTLSFGGRTRRLAVNKEIVNWLKSPEDGEDA